MIYIFFFLDTDNIKEQQQKINKTLGLEIIGSSDIITSDDIMIPSTLSKPNLKVSNRYIFKYNFIYLFQFIIIHFYFNIISIIL